MTDAKVDQSIALLRSMFADQQRILGPDYPSTFTTRRDLASLLKQ